MITIKNTPHEIQDQWLVSDLLYGVLVVIILVSTSYHELNLIGKQLQISLHLEEIFLKSISSPSLLPDEKQLYMIVNGRYPRCYECGSEMHLDIDCLQAKATTKISSDINKKLPLLPTPLTNEKKTQKANRKK